MCSSGSVFLPPSPGNSPPLERSSRSSCSSVGSSTHEGEGSFTFGAPLRRMVPIESLDSSTSSWENFENDDEEEPWVSSPESSLSLSNFVELEAMVDEYLSRYQDCEIDHNIIVIEKSQDARETMHPPQSVMILRLPPDSSELKILRFLNSDPVREDPWNPGPRVLHLSERENVTVVCMERLFEYDQPPLQTVANIIDFVRQQLEGLSFLHEHRIAHRAYEDTTSIMVDLGRSTHEGFDRVIYPVRYYRVDFSLAEQMGINTSPRHPAFIQDIQACGRMFLRLMPEVPNIQKKLKSLAAAMVGGGYSAADARKLFEALCRTVDSKTYEALLVSGALKGVTP